MNMCVIRLPAWLNDLLQLGQLYFFSPLCTNRCVFRFPACLNDLSHCGHKFFFSSVWHNKWIFRWAARLNDSLHCAHLCDFSPVWVITCVASLLVHMKELMFNWWGRQGTHILVRANSSKRRSRRSARTLFIFPDAWQPALVRQGWIRRTLKHCPTVWKYIRYIRCFKTLPACSRHIGGDH